MVYLYFLGLVLFILLGEINSVAIPEYQPEAVTKNGKIWGLYKKSYSGHLYRSFEGIPYAEPTFNENRFKEPILYKKKWKGVLNATTQGSPCLHYNQFHKEHGNYAVMGDEDCFYLNVYTREDNRSTTFKDKPVIINFHPGGFGQTSSEEISPEYMMDKTGFILVTFNYRLGILGFLSTGDYVVPGNNGLKDQAILIKWVVENIYGFGGNASQITLMGLSAGGASVMYHMLSPMTRDLFQRAISISGTALCPWALILDVPQQTRKLATLLGCSTEHANVMVDCLRQRPAHVIVRQMQHFQTWLYNPFTVFGPMIEPKTVRNFMTEYPVDTLNTIWPLWPIQQPWLLSVTSDDGLYPGAEFVFDNKLMADLDDNWKTIAPHILHFNHSIPKKEHNNISEAIRKHYLKKYKISINSRNELIKMLTDRLFTAPAFNAAVMVAKKSRWPVYFYVYSQNNSVSLSSFLAGTNTVIGSAHGDDYSLILKLQGLNTRNTKEDKEMGDILMNIILRFVKTGQVPKKFNWWQVKTARKFPYLDMRAPHDIKMRVDDELGNRKGLAKIFQIEKSTSVGKDVRLDYE